MKITHDTLSDVLMVRFNNKPYAISEVFNEDFVLHLAEDGQIIGIETLGASRHVSEANKIEYEDVTVHPEARKGVS